MRDEFLRREAPWKSRANSRSLPAGSTGKVRDFWGAAWWSAISGHVVVRVDFLVRIFFY
jgi:hypothetical protein